MSKEKNTPKKTAHNSKEIVALSDFEHCLLRPTMYVGSVDLSEEKVHIIEKGQLIEKNKTLSVGFYKMLNEIVDNAFDEAKRLNGAMPRITVSINSQTGEVEVQDTGNGFIHAEKKNPKTGVSNVETAVSILRAGSNFHNNQSEDSLIGMNGVGAALVNMLSDEFEIHTVNPNVSYHISWYQFQKKKEEVTKRNRLPLGTTVRFKHRADIFAESVWDKEYLYSMFVFRNFLKKKDPLLNNLKLEFFFDGVQLDLDIDFIPSGAFMVSSPIGVLWMWSKFEHSSSVSFINGTNCTGIHQKIILDWVNDIFKYPTAHHFYETMLVLNLPPSLLKFADQNKTRYAVKKTEIQEVLQKNFKTSLTHKLPVSDFYLTIQKSIEAHTRDAELKTIKNKKKTAQKKISAKYFPPTQSKGTLFLVEGLSAMASVLQKRDPRVDGVYSLKGKIKNARVLNDLSSNEEIIDLMQILNLEPNNGSKCSFAHIVIATDPDPDGLGHIASLIINLFYRWFPQVIDSGKLSILSLPLITADVGAKRRYFYSLDEWSQFTSKPNQAKNIRYLKGLGSLSLADWAYVMGERKTFKIQNDKDAAHSMDIAFGISPEKRKKWLEDG
jgi:DNA gyrase subunit B